MGVSEKLASFRIAVPADGSGAQVEVNGVDVAAHVGALRYEVQQGAHPLLTLFGPAAGVIEGAGVVHVVTEQDAREMIRDFLSEIDPEELERRALERADFGSGNLTKIMLDVLASWADGADLGS
jgi:hypothetical protein